MQTQVRTDQVNLPIALDVVSREVDSRRLSVQHGKFATIGLPGKGDDAVCKGKTKTIMLT